MMKLIEPLKSRVTSILLILCMLLVNAYCSLQLPVYTAKIVDIGIQNLDMDYIINTGGEMLLMISIAIISMIMISFLSSRVSSGYARDLRDLVYVKVLKFSNHELNKLSKASLITRSVNDIAQIQNISEITLTTVVLAPILGIGSIIKVIEIDFKLSWIVFVVFLIVLVVFIFAIKFIVPFIDKFQITTDELNKNSREILTGMLVIKSFVRQDFEEEKFEKSNRKLYDLNFYIYKLFLLLNPLMLLVLNATIVCVIYFGAYESIAGRILTGDIIAFTQYLTQIISVFVMIATFLAIIPRVIISGRRVNEILETEVIIEEGDVYSIEENAILEFRDVSYQYFGSEKETLSNISFKLEPGKVTAIVGGTGSGKSSILNLIPRLHDPTSGEILINGNNIKNYTFRALRDKISFAPQKAILLQGTVKTNVLMGNVNASDDEIEKALNNAQVDFINSIDDEVKRGGSNFSGGQKQRLSIARAFVKQSNFYLFDDCFSALDMNTEKIIKDNLKNLNDSSILIVSQRISTIRDADEIIVIDNGWIVDKGSHKKLVESCELYKEIVDSQTDILGGK